MGLHSQDHIERQFHIQAVVLGSSGSSQMFKRALLREAANRMSGSYYTMENCVLTGLGHPWRGTLERKLQCNLELLPEARKIIVVTCSREACSEDLLKTLKMIAGTEPCFTLSLSPRTRYVQKSPSFQRVMRV